MVIWWKQDTNTHSAQHFCDLNKFRRKDSRVVAINQGVVITSLIVIDWSFTLQCCGPNDPNLKTPTVLQPQKRVLEKHYYEATFEKCAQNDSDLSKKSLQSLRKVSQSDSEAILKKYGQDDTDMKKKISTASENGSRAILMPFLRRTIKMTSSFMKISLQPQETFLERF